MSGQKAGPAIAENEEACPDDEQLTAAQKKRRRRKKRNAEAKAAVGEGTQRAHGVDAAVGELESHTVGMRLSISSYKSAPTAMLRSSLHGCDLYHRPQKGRPGLPMQVPWEANAVYRMPLGCAIWNAGIVLKDFVDATISSLVDICGVDQAHVLELGAGTGVCGLSLTGRQRVASLTLTDGDPVTLKLLEFNNQLNQNRATVQACQWGQRASMDALLVGRQDGFDLLLASDCTYNTALCAPFWSTIANLLAVHGVVVVAHVVRESVGIEQMLHVATESDFECFIPKLELDTAAERSRGDNDRWVTKTNATDERGNNTTIEIYLFKRVSIC